MNEPYIKNHVRCSDLENQSSYFALHLQRKTPFFVVMMKKIMIERENRIQIRTNVQLCMFGDKAMSVARLQ